MVHMVVQIKRWTIFRTEVVNEYEVLRCINKAIEIDEKDLDLTLSKDYWWLESI